MPQFDQYPSSPLIKALYQGDSGVGKTGSSVSLGAVGYNVRIADLDNMAVVIKDYVTNPDSMYVKASPGRWTAEQGKTLSRRMSYVPLSEEFHQPKGAPRPIPKATAWTRFCTLLDKWVDGAEDLGPISTWTERDVLWIDTLTKMSQAAWNHQLAMNGRLLGRPEQNDYWQAQKLIEGVLLMLASEQVKCHVIVVCHLDYIENDAGLTRGYPQTVGKALSPTLARNFNHVLMAKSTGQGANVSRKILTSTTGTIDLKTPVPLRVKPEYDLATGLADYFRDVRGKDGP